MISAAYIKKKIYLKLLNAEIFLEKKETNPIR